jgi:S-DNA-T family DNA segregation ATPase FtsK/SpoIIIE
MNNNLVQGTPAASPIVPTDPPTSPTDLDGDVELEAEDEDPGFDPAGQGTEAPAESLGAGPDEREGGPLPGNRDWRRAVESGGVSGVLETAGGLASPYDQLLRLSATYNHEIQDAWNQGVEQIEHDFRAISEERDAALAPGLAAYSETSERIEKELAASAQKVATEVAELRNEQSTFEEESSSFVRRLWQRIGSQLDISEPALPASLEGYDFEADSTGMDYASCRAQLEQVKGFPPLDQDPLVRVNLPWIAGITLVLVGANSGSLSTGFFAGLWAAAGVLIWRHWRRSSARDTFVRLVDLTPIEQAGRRRAMGARIAELNARAEQTAAHCGERLRAAQAARDEQLTELHARFEAPIRGLTQRWQAQRERFAEHLGDWGLRVDRAIAGDPARLGPWTSTTPLPAGMPTLRDQLRFRIGDLVLRPLQGLAPDAAALLQCSAEPPELPAARPPAFFDLGLKQSMLVYTDAPAGVGACTVFEGAIARALMHLPPGKLQLTLFDPVGLGRSFSPFLKLSDYSDLLINGKVWSEKEHIRRKLKELIEHIETVTQKYLRADFDDIESYNAKAGEIAEAYRFLVVADFPDGFDEDSTKDLIRIVQNGARCGVFAFVHVNRDAPLPYGVSLDPLESFCCRLTPETDGSHQLAGLNQSPAADESQAVTLDTRPLAENLDEIVKVFGEGAQSAKAVEVPFRQMLERAKIPENQWWERSSQKGIEVPLGPTGAKKIQMLTLGTGLAHHALLVGRPGSGKSNLIHVFISTLARLYSPAEVQLYLVDFKKGVEFKPYADALLPHARVIAVESEREFGLSVMQGLDAELKRRGEQFRQAGTSSYVEYRQKGNDNFPRIVLIVDEFQEFFSREDKVSRECATLFDRLVRQGRAFGIHLVLGTQSLANAGLQKSTQDQMAVRIALQCSEADSRLILAEDNAVARSLSRPGEAIYNAAAGLIEGNSQFQVAMFSEEDRSREIGAILKTAARKKWKGEPPVIFEGHEPADLSVSGPLLGAQPKKPGQKLEMWLGEPIALKPPVSATLARQSGRNMLVLTRDEQQGVAVILASLSAIAAQSAPDDASFRIVDLTAADAEWADHPEAFADAIPHDAEVVGKRGLRTLLPELEAIVTDRTDREATSEPSVILALLGLHRARDLRSDDAGGFANAFDSEPAVNLTRCLEKILQDGPDVGVHALLWCDSFGNLERVVDRRGLNEIGLRVSGSLSPAESHRLFDEEVAAGIDKPHRLVKFDDEHVGVFELFRPYSLPTPAFLQTFAGRLRNSATPDKERPNG